MGLDWWNGSVHHAFGSFIHLLCGERDKGSGRAPLVNPRGPARKSVLRTALTSRVPDCGRLDSACSPLRTRSMPRFASVRHPWRPDLVIHASVRRFQRGHNPIAVRPEVKALSVSLNARFCRPDKAKPPSGNCAAVVMPDGATLIRPTPFQQRYIPAIGA
jgi:hypothetical protein